MAAYENMASMVFQILIVIGCLTCMQSLYRFWKFISLYYSPPGYTRYLHGNAPYALITGATDGIGKAVAEELHRKGFNLILHGRNEDKLAKVVQSLKDQGARDIKYFLASADDKAVPFDKFAEQFKGLNVTLLINNVAQSALHPETIDHYPEVEILTDVRVNCLFAMSLTRAFLPNLRASPGPTHVIFVGSIGHRLPIPRLYTYTSSKAFLRQLTRSLNADERYKPVSKFGVTFSYLEIGTVVTNTNRTTVGPFTPTAKGFAKSFMDTIGCGREVYFPYIRHAVQSWFLGFLPDSVVEKSAAESMEGMFAQKRD